MKQLLLFLILVAGYTQAAKPAPTVVPPLKLVDRQTNARVDFVDGITVQSGTYAVQAQVNAQTQSVRFVLDNAAQTPKNVSPFFSDDMTPANGQHIMVVSPYSADDAAGTKGDSITVNFTVGAGSTPTPTLTPTPTATPAPTLTPTPTATPIPTSTPTPTAAPTSTPTPVPTVTPNPTRTVTVIIVNPTLNNTYEIYCNGAMVAILNGADQVGVPNLNVGETYQFSNRVLVNRVPSVMSDPVSYTVTAATTQQVSMTSVANKLKKRKK
jgi:hypothetical protein